MRIPSEGLRDGMTVPEVSHPASFYYLKHITMRALSKGLRNGMAMPEMSHLASFRLGCRPCPVKSPSPRCALTGVVCTWGVVVFSQTWPSSVSSMHGDRGWVPSEHICLR